MPIVNNTVTPLIPLTMVDTPEIAVTSNVGPMSIRRDINDYEGRAEEIPAISWAERARACEEWEKWGLAEKCWRYAAESAAAAGSNMEVNYRSRIEFCSNQYMNMLMNLFAS